MGSYSLNISLTNEDLKLISLAQQKVVIVKETDDSNNSLAQKTLRNDMTDVAWVTFDPFQANNVKWEETYEIYASSTELQSGATIQKASFVSAMPKSMIYCFQNSRIFTTKDYSGGLSTAYYMENDNDDYDYLTFGLAQTVSVNDLSKDMNPVNAVAVPSNNTAHFIPIVRLKIFLASQVNDGKVISATQSKALSVDFTQKSERSVRYDSNAKQFVISD